MQRPEGPSGENQGAKGKRPEPLPPLVSAALEPGTPTLAARLQRIARHGAAAARYTVLGELAQGGMGRVLRAWDEALAREVAMKVVPGSAPSAASEDERADHEKRLVRFIDEARITGQLDHPGIVPVYEIGLDESGAVFFTMPLVRGENLKSVFARVHAGDDGWTLQRAVDVMHKVCLTVAFAHRKGVVHRDLKPENVMVGPFGEAYVMDWGLALLLGRAEKQTIVGTPAYMSPEQAAGRNDEVGPRSDVYSLGAMLYELFARRVPHELSMEKSARTGESFEHVLAVPPRPLSELREDVPPELAAICAKAMARAPLERYASALEMADDLEAWLAGRVVSVHETGPWMRLRKWRARNRALALALDALVALFLAGGAVFFVQQRSWLREVQAKHHQALVSAYAAGLSAADLGLRAQEVGESKRRLAACDPSLRGWEWRHLALRADASERVLEGRDGTVRSVAVSPDGRTVASATDGGAVVLWDARTGQPRARLEAHAAAVMCVAFSPDGTRLASASRDKHVLLWDATSGALERVVCVHAEDVIALAFSEDGDRLASGDRMGTIVVSSVAAGERMACLSPASKDSLVALACVPGANAFAAAYLTGFVRLFDPSLDLVRETRVSKSSISGLAVDPQGCLIAVGLEHSARLLDALTLAPVADLDTQSKLGALAFSPDGTRLATTGFEGFLRVWNVARRSVAYEYGGHDDEVNAVAFFPDGRRLVTGSEDDTLRTWDLRRVPVLVLDEHGPWLDSLAFAPDGRTLLAGARDGALRLFDAHTGNLLASAATPGVVDCVAWGRGDEFFYGCGDAAPRRAHARTLGESSAFPAGGGFPKTMQYDPASARLFTRDSKGVVRAYDTAAERELATLETADETDSLALSPDGRLLAAGTKGGAVRLWDARSYAPLADLPGASPVSALAFSPDGRHLAVGRLNRSIDLFAAARRTRERTFEGHENLVACLAFSPDGKRLVSGSYDRTLRVWSVDSDEALLTLHGHALAVTAVCFDPRGEVVASASIDETLRLWRTAQAFEVARADAAPAPPQ